MDKQDTIDLVSSMTRHGVTFAAGLMAANGLVGASSTATEFIAPAAALAGTVVWSFVSRNALVSKLVSAVDVSDIEELANIVGEFKQRGANPALIAHLAQTLALITASEVRATLTPSAGAAEVEATSGAVSSPAPEVVPTPVIDGGTDVQAQ